MLSVSTVHYVERFFGVVRLEERGIQDEVIEDTIISLRRS